MFFPEFAAESTFADRSAALAVRVLLLSAPAALPAAVSAGSAARGLERLALPVVFLAQVGLWAAACRLTYGASDMDEVTMAARRHVARMLVQGPAHAAAMALALCGERPWALLLVLAAAGVLADRADGAPRVALAAASLLCVVSAAAQTELAVSALSLALLLPAWLYGASPAAAGADASRGRAAAAAADGADAGAVGGRGVVYNQALGAAADEDHRAARA